MGLWGWWGRGVSSSLFIAASAVAESSMTSISPRAHAPCPPGLQLSYRPGAQVRISCRQRVHSNMIYASKSLFETVSSTKLLQMRKGTRLHTPAHASTCAGPSAPRTPRLAGLAGPIRPPLPAPATEPAQGQLHQLPLGQMDTCLGIMGCLMHAFLPSAALWSPEGDPSWRRMGMCQGWELPPVSGRQRVWAPPCPACPARNPGHGCQLHSLAPGTASCGDLQPSRCGSQPRAAPHHTAPAGAARPHCQGALRCWLGSRLPGCVGHRCGESDGLAGVGVPHS